MAHQIGWFDVPVSDLRRACDFYDAVLSVKTEMHEGGVAVAVFPHGPGDVAGCLVQSEGFVPSGQGPLLYFTVEGRLGAAVAEVEPNGGQVLEPAQPIPPYGNRAVVLDSEGNRIALFSGS